MLLKVENKNNFCVCGHLAHKITIRQNSVFLHTLISIYIVIFFQTLMQSMRFKYFLDTFGCLHLHCHKHKENMKEGETKQRSTPHHLIEWFSWSSIFMTLPKISLAHKLPIFLTLISIDKLKDQAKSIHLYLDSMSC